MTTDLPPGSLVGYIRVSTGHQTLDAQRDKLAPLAPMRIFAEQRSGKAGVQRPEFDAMLAYLRPGDIVVVTSLDRLGRSLSGIVRTIEDLRQRGIYIRALRESIDTSTSVGRMLAGIFASLAEYERELIAERAGIAREAAARRGKAIGRPRKLDVAQTALAVRMRNSGESVATIRETLGCARSTLYRALGPA